ncbi:MAG: phenylalanine--tRNA ligase subunit beta [Candidatus Phytoplasma stylosanthis]|nr:phenylalanine--tRNA ligase subunit beta [Candidatus Phytoplasma stylosanthis]
MIITEKFLKKYFHINNYNWDELQLLVNDYITEIEKIDQFEPNFDFVVGKIIALKKINEKENFFLVTVDIKKKILNIICKDNNLEINTKIAISLEEKYINSMNVYLKTKNILKTDTQGIICSYKELKLNPEILTEKEKKGILILDDEAPVGENVLDYLSLQGGLWKLNITPDKGYLLSYIGFAQELKIISDIYKFESLPDKKDKIQEKTDNPFKIKIMDENCLEYNTRFISDIKVKKSPLWLRSLLFSHKINPVNNIIDIINFILIKYGIPLDVFDVSHLNFQNIEIRKAKKGEIFKYSEHKKFHLDENNLIIANEKNIMSVAGIINAHENNIKIDTKKIIIGSSILEPSNILKTSKKLNIENEKSFRSTKGTDCSLIIKALNEAVFLLQEIDEKIIISNIKSEKIKERVNSIILFSLDELNKKIGINFALNEVEIFLKKLDYEILTIENNIFQVKASLKRYDVIIPEDVFSDIIRVYGYKKIKIYQPIQTQNFSINQKKENLNKIKNLLSNLGFFEIINYSLINKKKLDLFPYSANYIKIVNPISQEHTILRQHLSGSMIQTLSYNQKNYNYDNSFFEIGKIYHHKEEKLHLSLGLSGNFISQNWHQSNIESSFFVLKGVLFQISSKLGLRLNFKKTSSYLSLHPEKQADIFYKDEKIGFLGEVHPYLENIFHLKKSFIAEIDLEKFQLEKSKNIIFQPITKFPSIVRDLSFFISKKYSFQNIKEVLIKDTPSFLIKCELVDIYESKKISSTDHSLSFRLIFNDKKKNLSNEIINKVMSQIEEKIKSNFNAKIR